MSFILLIYRHLPCILPGKCVVCGLVSAREVSEEEEEEEEEESVSL